MIRHILLAKLRNFLKLSATLDTATVVKHIASLVVFGGFAAAAMIASRMATDYLLDSARLGLFLLHRFISMLLFVFFISINVGNVIVSYATLYRSPETAFFLTKPVSHTSLFVVRFLDNFFYSSVAFFLVALAVLLGYGSHFHMGWVFYLQTLVLMLLPLMLIAGCAAVIMLMIVMKIAEHMGIRRIVAMLAAAYLGILFVYFKMSNPMGLVNSVMQYYPHVDQYFAGLDPPFAQYLPTQWIAESLYWTMRGDGSYALSYTLLLLLATAALFALMLLTARKLFYPSWMSAMKLQSAEESRKPLFRFLSLTSPAGRLDPQLSALMKKEFWQFIREPSQWIHLGVISVLVLTFVASIAQINMRQTLPFLQTVSYMVLLLFNAFLIASIALRFVYPIVSVEGMSFWSVLSAPVERKQVYWLKFVLSFVPIFLISELLVIFSHRSLGDYVVIVRLASLIMLAITYAMVGLNLGAGTFFTNFREKNPIRVASSQGATLTFLVSMFYLAIVVASVFIPFNDYFAFVLRGIPFDAATMTTAAAIVFAISIALGSFSLVVGLRSLERDF